MFHLEVVRDDFRPSLDSDDILTRLEALDPVVAATHAKAAGWNPTRDDVLFDNGSSSEWASRGLALYAFNAVYENIDDVLAAKESDCLTTRTIGGERYLVGVKHMACVLRYLILTGMIPDRS